MRVNTADTFEQTARYGGTTEAFRRNLELKRRLEKEERIAKLSEEAMAAIFRYRSVPDWLRVIIRACAEKHRVKAFLVMTAGRQMGVVKARNEAMYLARERNPEINSFPRIGRWFDIDHTSVIHGVRRHAEINGVVQLVKGKGKH